MVKREPIDRKVPSPGSKTKEDTPTEANKRRIEYDDLYRRSTQYRVWSFTEKELQLKRDQINSRGRQLAIEKAKKLDMGLENSIELLSVEEELKIIAYYARKAIGLSNLFKAPSQVRGTAISFLKKFYLEHSVMEYHPKNIMLTCLFLAAKAEDYFIGIKTFASKINNINPETVLKYEYLVIQSLQFTLMVHHPFRSLYGFYLDIQTVLPKIDKKKIGASYDRTKELINESLISDIAFLYTPPQIALASWRKVNRELVDRYLRKKFVASVNSQKQAPAMSPIKEENTDDNNLDSDDTAAIKQSADNAEEQQLQRLITVLSQCEAYLNTGYDPALEELKPIDKKVHYCITPAKMLKRKRDATNPGSATGTPTPVPTTTTTIQSPGAESEAPDAKKQKVD